MLTYGDGVGNIDITQLLKFHQENKKMVTLTAVQPKGRFGGLDLEDNIVTSFEEKPQGDGNWVNGGFFVCEPTIFSFLENDTTIWERNPLENIAKQQQLISFKHTGFWRPMDTLRDKIELNELWDKNQAEWKLWK
jgi:glucose-1-phosphate cytidylyltransferase